MKVLLTKEGCSKSVSENTAQENRDDNWTKMDSKAMQIIVLCIEDKQLVHVKKAKTAKEAWEKLKAYHKKSTLWCRIRILKRLFKAELTKNGSMEDHLQDIFESLDELSDMDNALEDSMAVSIILASLN